MIAPAGACVGQWLQSFRHFPPRQKPGNVNPDRVMDTVMSISEQQCRPVVKHGMSGTRARR